MKKLLILILVILVPLFGSAQNAKSINKFFKSYEDYKADKPVDGVSLNAWKEFSSSVEMTENGTKQKIKVSKLLYPWFVTSEGFLMRVFDGDLYYVLVEGPLSFYIKCS